MQTPTKARFVIPVILALLCLLPIATLFHHDPLEGWRMNRSLMAEPDEPSYVLMAKSIATGHRFSVASITGGGRDTFYPPGLPLVLAAWGKIFGFSLESLHVCIALTLSLAILLSYFLLRRIFILWNQAHADIYALFIAALFATSWHALENAHSIFSEPLFMVMLFAWLLVALKADRWWMRPRAAAGVAILACAAWLVRSAGVVCLAATLLYIVIGILRHGRGTPRADTKARVLSLVFATAVIFAVVVVIQLLTPAAPNSYSQQLFSRFGVDTFRAMWHHLGDFASVLIPTPSWEPEYPQEFYFVRLGPLLLVPCIAGAICRLFRRGYAPTRFVEIFFALYVLLFLLWPFEFVRFWIPILPLALAYATYFIRHARPQLKLALPMLAIILNLEQAIRLFPMWQARLAYVSDCLEETATVIRKNSPDPKRTIICADNEDFFTLSWYLNPSLDETSYRITSPDPRGRNEPVILKQLEAARASNSKFFIVSYFKHDPRVPGEPTIHLVLNNLQNDHPNLFNEKTVTKLRQRWYITAVWEVTPP